MHRTSESGDGGLRVAAVFLALGLALLLCSVLVGFSGWTDTYKHEVRDIPSDSEQVRTAETILTSDDITIDEQAVLLETITSDSPVYRSEPVGLRFQYPDGTEGNKYLIEFDGAYYVLETATDQRPQLVVATGARISFAIAGLLLVVAGGVPTLRTALAPDTVFTRPLKQLLGVCFPVWAVLILVPAVVLGLVYPLVFETVVELPLSLFVTPFLLATGLCTALTALALGATDISDTVFLGSAVNAPIVWMTLVAADVAPGGGRARATLTLLVGVSGFSVLIGQVLGWYVLRWHELRQQERPHSPSYWRI
jgi:hypothetical protein